MTVHISEALDGARYVDFRDAGAGQVCWVWHGGHTVNMYRLGVDPEPRQDVKPLDSISVGDFETGEVSLADVQDGIDSHEQVTLGSH